MSTPSGSAGHSADEAGYFAHGRTCPRCSGSVYRIPRRFADVLFSRFISIHRYRCDSMGCSWEGNLRVNRHSLLIGMTRKSV